MIIDSKPQINGHFSNDSVYDFLFAYPYNFAYPYKLSASSLLSYQINHCKDQDKVTKKREMSRTSLNYTLFYIKQIITKTINQRMLYGDRQHTHKHTTEIDINTLKNSSWE